MKKETINDYIEEVRYSEKLENEDITFTKIDDDSRSIRFRENDEIIVCLNGKAYNYFSIKGIHNFLKSVSIKEL